MKHKMLTLTAALIISNAGLATAEDDYRYSGEQNVYVQQEPVYQIPPAYEGQYYPQEQQGYTSYYGTKRESENHLSNDIRDNADGYSNYYY